MTHENGRKVITATTHVMTVIEHFDLMNYRKRLTTTQKRSDEQNLGIRICFGLETLYTASM